MSDGTGNFFIAGQVNIRFVNTSDYMFAKSVVDDWWGGRRMSHLLQKWFFDHFQTTSFVANRDGKPIGFLIGLVSQTDPVEAYIHFIGVHPDYRKYGLARLLYDTFFETVRGLGCTKVRCITSPVNEASIAFHTRMGFSVQMGMDYEGPGEHRVLFAREI